MLITLVFVISGCSSSDIENRPYAANVSSTTNRLKPEPSIVALQPYKPAIKKSPTASAVVFLEKEDWQEIQWFVHGGDIDTPGTRSWIDKEGIRHVLAIQDGGGISVSLTKDEKPLFAYSINVQGVAYAPQEPGIELKMTRNIKNIVNYIK